MNTNSNPPQVVCGVLRNARGKLLAAQRAPGYKHAGWWEFPGGKVQNAELPEKALAREWQEELQLSIQVRHCLGTHPLGSSPVGLKMLAAYQVELLGPLNPTLTEHSRYAWFTFKELETLQLLPADLALLPQIERNLIR